MNKQQNFTVTFEQITTETRSCSSDCNEIMFINKGVATAFVEQFPLAQNEFITIGGNRDEFCTKNFNVVAGAGTQLFVIRKNYV